MSKVFISGWHKWHPLTNEGQAIIDQWEREDYEQLVEWYAKTHPLTIAYLKTKCGR